MYNSVKHIRNKIKKKDLGITQVFINLGLNNDINKFIYIKM